jgi:N-acetyl-gamma-glutamyl-phosphate reductase
MPPRVFIDGHVGTAGLRIRELLADRTDLELLLADETRRKQPEERREAAAAADLVLLCLPDDAAREAVSWLADSDTRVIDASTAHRVAPGWGYGLPELVPEQRDQIREAARVSNPGCYATAIILALRPLIDAGLIGRDAPLAVHAISGYSGGGRAMIERWQDPESGLLQLAHPAPYALDRVHKHMPEVTHYAGLAGAPQFAPAVGPYRCGMRVDLPLPVGVLAPGSSGKAIWEALHARYDGELFVRVAALEEPLSTDERSFDPQGLNDTNRLEIAVVPHPSGHVLVRVRLDNLGKGAAGVAVQSLNLMLGLPEATGLVAW